MRTMLTFLLLFIITCKGVAQQAIDVTDQKIKVNGLSEEVLYFGFAAGDKIIFNFEEVDKKELKELEISEYPDNSKFSDFKTSKIENKALDVTQTSVYKFRFKNTALGGRICKLKIQRIPANEGARNFNCAVKWETKEETTYNKYFKDIIVGYDTLYTERIEHELVKTEIREELILDKSQRVHSETNQNSSKTSLFFTLPLNENTPYKTSNVVSWAYWVGVDAAGGNAWKENVKILSTVAKKSAIYWTSPLGALAIGAVADLMVPTLGEDVSYSIADKANKDLFMLGKEYLIYDQGKGVAGYRKFINADLCQGQFFILLYNDNMMLGVDAQVKVSAMIETNYYGDKKYRDMTVKPRYEKKEFSDPIIKTYTIPVAGK